MEQTEIKRQADELQGQIDAHQNEIELLRVKKKQLQRICTHPNDQRYSAQGDIGHHCPDCGRYT